MLVDFEPVNMPDYGPFPRNEICVTAAAYLSTYMWMGRGGMGVLWEAAYRLVLSGLYASR